MCQAIGPVSDLLSGKDATDAFEDIGHSDEAREILAGLLVGPLETDGVRSASLLCKVTVYEFLSSRSS